MPLHRLFDPLYVLQLLRNIPHTSHRASPFNFGASAGQLQYRIYEALSRFIVFFRATRQSNKFVINQQSSSSICTICGSSSSSSVYQITVPRQWQSFGLDETISATSGRRRGVVARIPRRQTRPVLQRGGTATTHRRTGSIWRRTGNL